MATWWVHSFIQNSMPEVLDIALKEVLAYVFQVEWLVWYVNSGSENLEELNIYNLTMASTIQIGILNMYGYNYTGF